MFLVQHFVFGFTGLIVAAIPDVPSKLQIQIQRENQLDREAFFEMEYQQAKERMAAGGKPGGGPDDRDGDSLGGRNLNMTSLDSVYFRDNASLANNYSHSRKRIPAEEMF